MDHTTTDTKLWEDFKKGENYALSHIYYLYADHLFGYGRKFTNDSELVKDTIQDLFVDLIRTRSSLGNTDHIYFYLIKAMRRRLFHSISGTEKHHKSVQLAQNQLVNFEYSIEEDWIQREQLSEKEEYIRKGLAKLSNKQREILYYRFTCDFEYNQICEIMSMNYDSARKMVFRALKSLRENLTQINFTFLLFCFH